MTQITKCAECGARLEIPEKGLTMTCSFCGFSCPAPDAERRREIIAEEEEEQRQQEIDVQEEEERQESRREEKREAKWDALSGSLPTILGIVIGLIVLGVVIVKKGVADAFFGDDSAAILEQMSAELGKSGYELISEKQHERFYYGYNKLNIDLEKDHCYVMAIASNKTVFHALVRARPKLVEYPNSKQVNLSYCAEETAKANVAVALLGPGQFTWALFLNKNQKAPKVVEAPSAPAPALPVVQFKKSCKVRKKPASGGRSIGMVRPNTGYYLLEKNQKNWRKVRLPDGVEGWTNCSPK